MKVDGKGHPPGVGPSDVEAKPPAGALNELAPDAASGPSPTGKSFAEKLVATPQTASPGVGTTTPPRVGDIPVADLAADLRSGKLSAGEAADRIVERVVARQFGPDAPAAVRDQVRAALRDAIENDPLMAEKLRQLD